MPPSVSQKKCALVKLSPPITACASFCLPFIQRSANVQFLSRINSLKGVRFSSVSGQHSTSLLNDKTAGNQSVLPN